MKYLKQFVVWMIVAFVMVGLTACQKETTQTKMTAQVTELKKKQIKQTKGKSLVVYFSATGTTKKVAEKLAKVTKADLYRIRPAKPYTAADLNYNKDNSRSTKEMNNSHARPKMKGKKISLKKYKTIYLGYPIWWGEAPRIMDTFVESYNFKGKTIVPFCTSSSSDIGMSAKHLANLAKSGTWMEGRRFDGDVSRSTLKNWDFV